MSKILDTLKVEGLVTTSGAHRFSLEGREVDLSDVPVRKLTRLVQVVSGALEDGQLTILELVSIGQAVAGLVFRKKGGGVAREVGEAVEAVVEAVQPEPNDVEVAPEKPRRGRARRSE